MIIFEFTNPITMFKLKNSLTYLFVCFLMCSCNIEPFEGEIPSEDDVILKPSSCEEAIMNTASASQAVVSINSSDPSYPDLCNAYKTALEFQLELCGDEGGALKIIIESLNCSAGDSQNTTEVFAFMTANINGVQYDDMKPNAYLFFPGGATVNGIFARPDDDYLGIFGNSGYKNPTLVEASDRAIELHIPKALWDEGTYTLYDEFNDVFEGVCYFLYTDVSTLGTDFSIKDLPGEITISKFSLDERVIQGTFEFEYLIVNQIDNSEEGPYQVTGTFNYSLDDDYFD